MKPLCPAGRGTFSNWVRKDELGIEVKSMEGKEMGNRGFGLRKRRGWRGGGSSRVSGKRSGRNGWLGEDEDREWRRRGGDVGRELGSPWRRVRRDSLRTGLRELFRDE